MFALLKSVSLTTYWCAYLCRAHIETLFTDQAIENRLQQYRKENIAYEETLKYSRFQRKSRNGCACFHGQQAENQNTKFDKTKVNLTCRCLKGLHDQSMCCHDTALQLESIVDSSSKLIEILLDIETADKINDESTDILRNKPNITSKFARTIKRYLCALVRQTFKTLSRQSSIVNSVFTFQPEHSPIFNCVFRVISLIFRLLENSFLQLFACSKFLSSMFRFAFRKIA